MPFALFRTGDRDDRALGNDEEKCSTHYWIEPAREGSVCHARMGSLGVPVALLLRWLRAFSQEIVGEAVQAGDQGLPGGVGRKEDNRFADDCTYNTRIGEIVAYGESD